MKTTKWIAALSAHTTADNREISNDLVKLLAETYNPDFYTARVNLEHIQWYVRFGDVVEAKTEMENGLQKLFVRLSVNKYLEQINAAGQAVFLSVEFVKNFARTNKPYLVGLALTDNPASVGTGRVKLSANNQEITAETETICCGLKLDYQVETTKPTAEKTGVVAKFIQKFNTGDDEVKPEQLTQELEELTKSQNELSSKFTALEESNKKQSEELSAAAETIKKLTGDFEAQADKLKTTLENFSRPPATGEKPTEDFI